MEKLGSQKKLPVKVTPTGRPNPLPVRRTPVPSGGAVTEPTVAPPVSNKPVLTVNRPTPTSRPEPLTLSKPNLPVGGTKGLTLTTGSPPTKSLDLLLPDPAVPVRRPSLQQSVVTRQPSPSPLRVTGRSHTPAPLHLLPTDRSPSKVENPRPLHLSGRPPLPPPPSLHPSQAKSPIEVRTVDPPLPEKASRSDGRTRPNRGVLTIDRLLSGE